MRAQRRLGEPTLQKFVRLAPFLGAVAILVTNKKVPRRLTAQRRTGDSPPFDTAVIVPKCRSPNIWAAGQDLGLNGESETITFVSLLLAKQATRRRFGRWLGMARFAGYWP